MPTFSESEGRSAFGKEAANYEDSRPEYPNWMFDRLRDIGALDLGTNTLEIGPGNGLATRKLVERGAGPLTLVEPDRGFEPYLAGLKDGKGEPCKVEFESFEAFTGTDFDLVLIATTFHWLSPKTRMQKLAEVTKRTGYVALMWNVFQDMNLPDEFHEATKHLLTPLDSSPSGVPDQLPFALNWHEREIEFINSGRFALTLREESHWSFTLNSKGIRALYSGFSNISRLTPDKRESLLDDLAKIAEQEFDGEVTRNVTSPLYVFQRT